MPTVYARRSSAMDVVVVAMGLDKKILDQILIVVAVRGEKEASRMNQ